MSKKIPEKLGLGYRKAPYINTNSLSSLGVIMPSEYQDSEILKRLCNNFSSKGNTEDFLKENWSPNFLGHLGSMDIHTDASSTPKYTTLIYYEGEGIEIPKENIRAQFDSQVKLYDLIFDPELMKSWAVMHIESPYWKTDSFIQIQNKMSIDIRSYIAELDEKYAYDLNPLIRKGDNGFMTPTEYEHFALCIQKNPIFMGKLVIGVQGFQDMWASSLVRYNEVIEAAVNNNKLELEAGINALKALFQPQSLWRTKISTEDYAPAIWLDWIIDNELIKYDSEKWVLDLPECNLLWPSLTEANFIRGTKWLNNSGAFIYTSKKGQKLVCPLVKVHPKVTSICTNSHDINPADSGKLIYQYYKATENIPSEDYKIIKTRIDDRISSGFNSHERHHKL